MNGTVPLRIPHSELANIQVTRCAWARVIEGTKPLSFCVQPEFTDTASAQFNFEPLSCGDTRRLIVISMSSDLADNSVITVINPLKQWFREQKTSGNYQPFDLYLVRNEATIIPALSCEQLKAADNFEHSWSRVYSSLSSFNATPAPTLLNLNGLRRMPGINITAPTKILYLTDSNNLNYKERKDIPGEELQLFGQYPDLIPEGRLSVLTLSSHCQHWGILDLPQDHCEVLTSETFTNGLQGEVGIQ